LTDEDKRRAAQTVLEVPFFLDVWKEMETAAINAIIAANINDDETRRNNAAEVRAIRRIRERLESIANNGQLSTHNRAPA
jgi:hypothetical protein